MEDLVIILVDKYNIFQDDKVNKFKTFIFSLKLRY